MKRISLLIIIIISVQFTFSQSKVFEQKAAKISQSIDSIIASEKEDLKKALKKIDKQLQRKEISSKEAELEKKKISEYHANRINTAVALEEKKLQDLIKLKVNGGLKDSDEEKIKNSFFKPYSEENFYTDKTTGLRIEKRWTSQFVIAFGVGTILGDDGSFYGDGFNVNPLGYGEIGFSFKYRLKEESNLLNLKLGFSAMMDELRPKADNDILVTNGDQTFLQDSGLDLIRTRFSNIYIGFPMHLELDFSKPQFSKKIRQNYLRSQKGFRMGLGGFFAFRVFTSQIIRYDDEDGKRIRIFQNDNFNVNNFNFGPSAYFGYKDVSLYIKYDVNPIFRNNPEDINQLSFGLRFDFN